MNADSIPEWADPFTEEVLEKARQGVLTWCLSMDKLGPRPEDLEKYKRVFVQNVEDTFEDMNKETEEMLSKVISDIEMLLKTSQELCKQLSLSMPDYGREQKGLYEERDLIRQQISKLQEMQAVRLSEVEKLTKREAGLCRSLGRTPKSLKTSPLPSQETMATFEQYLEEMEKDRFERFERFCMVKQNILAIINDVGIEPYMDFEKLIVENEDRAFLVTDSNMKQLDQYYESLLRQQAELKEQIETLRKEIESLWNVLEIDIKERELFRNQHKGHTVEILKILKAESMRCEELKRKNIQIFIEKKRKELTDAWDKALYTQEQRSQFQFFNTSLYTEDLLELHERELQSVNNHYEQNSEIYRLLEKHKNLWARLGELEHKQEQPNRYKNRGGQLLKEEKERNKLDKYIPNVEQKLMELAANYFVQNGRYFLVWGETVEEYINRLHETKREERKVKVSAKKQMRDQLTVTPGTSGVSLSATKRKMVTPLQSAEKKSRLALFKESKGLSTAPAASKVSYKVNKKVRTSLDRLKRLKNLSKNLNETTVNSTEYGAFEKQLENLDPNSRSTMFGLKENVEEFAKPLRTPTKKNVAKFQLTTPKGTVQNMRF